MRDINIRFALVLITSSALSHVAAADEDRCKPEYIDSGWRTGDETGKEIAQAIDSQLLASFSHLSDCFDRNGSKNLGTAEDSSAAGTGVNPVNSQPLDLAMGVDAEALPDQPQAQSNSDRELNQKRTTEDVDSTNVDQKHLLADDDDIAVLIREAYMLETDDTRKKALAAEYKKYTGKEIHGKIGG